MFRAAVLIAALAAACSRSRDTAAEGAGSGTAPAGGPSAPPGERGPAFPELAAVAGPFAAEFPEFDATVVAHALQGTWVFEGNMNRPTVWSVEGTKVTQVTADGETLAGDLVFRDPCTVSLELPDGGDTYVYAFLGGALHLGLGSSGVVVGETLYACPYPSLVRKSGDTCELVTGDVDDGGTRSHTWKATPCTADATTFTATDRFDRELALHIDGRALFDDQLKGSPAIEVADLAAGKAKQAELTRR